MISKTNVVTVYLQGHRNMMKDPTIKQRRVHNVFFAYYKAQRTPNNLYVQSLLLNAIIYLHNSNIPKTDKNDVISIRIPYRFISLTKEEEGGIKKIP